MINIVNLINATLIASGLGANLNKNFKLPELQPRQEGQYSTNYSTGLQTTGFYSNNTTKTVTYEYNNNLETYTIKDNYRRQDMEVSTSYLQIKGNIYKEDTLIDFYGNPDRQYGLMKTNVTPSDVPYFTNQLIMLQITPYNYHVNNEISLGVFMRFGFLPYYTGANYGTPYLKITRAITTANWSTYIDKTNYSANAIETLKTTMLNGNYYINREDTEMQIPIQGTEPTEETEWYHTTFQITPEQTNYIAIFLTPYVTRDEVWSDPNHYQMSPPYYGYAQNSLDNRMFETYPENTYISGTYIIPNTTTEIVDIPGIMFDVLTMPFTFISVAFNLTLFPGTPYQINISNLFFTIIGILIFIFILSMITSIPKMPFKGGAGK